MNEFQGCCEYVIAIFELDINKSFLPLQVEGLV